MKYATKTMFKLLALSLTLTYAGCDPLTVKGKVRSEESSETIAGATIHHLRMDTVVVTDADGKFYLSNMRLLDTMMVSAPGFQPQMAVLEYYGMKSHYDEITVFLSKDCGGR